MSLFCIGMPRQQRLLCIRMCFPKLFEYFARNDPHVNNLPCSHIGIESL